ncbi:hypothetical protein JCM19240_3686 [Vibrio maritimus]|uniref:Uncharacterized protein n=1 Tax=Vibrio maritimus TaxID=990268 RepID=A0A090T5U8_9VIBR|nr:hypothetical protein JCM19240_3686 [Vibrio maritimus]
MQSHIKGFAHALKLSEHYVLKLIEKVGELSESVRKDKCGLPSREELKGKVQSVMLTNQK